MTLDEIKTSVDSGKFVFWHNKNYRIIKNKHTGEYLIWSQFNDHCIGLTWRDGVTMNGKPGEFFVEDLK